MTQSDRPAEIPVDEANTDDVKEDAWDRDDSPARFYELLNESLAAAGAYQRTLAEIYASQATLAQIRKAKSLTQKVISTRLDMDQSEVSRLEHRTDMLLSTLRGFIQATGGDLHLIATYPDSPPVPINIGRPDWQAYGDDELSGSALAVEMAAQPVDQRRDIRSVPRESIPMLSPTGTPKDETPAKDNQNAAGARS